MSNQTIFICPKPTCELNISTKIYSEIILQINFCPVCGTKSNSKFPLSNNNTTFDKFIVPRGITEGLKNTINECIIPYVKSYVPVISTVSTTERSPSVLLITEQIDNYRHNFTDDKQFVIFVPVSSALTESSQKKIEKDYISVLTKFNLNNIRVISFRFCENFIDSYDQLIMRINQL